MSDTPALPPELTIYAVADCHAQCLAWAAQVDPEILRVDGSAVEEVDASGVQLLLALDKTLMRQSRRLALVHASDVLRQACTALGAARLLHEAAAVEVPA